MTRWLWMLIVVGSASLAAWCPVEAKDRSVAKSLTRTGPVVQGDRTRTCAGTDLFGNWQLVTFDSSYRFRNPQAPYLFPHQVFQYSPQGGIKSAHSLRPILNRPDQVFDSVPSGMTYRVEQGGLVVLKANGRDEAVETWTCRVVTQDHEEPGRRTFMQRGDLVMTLLGTGGQALFVRHLRKAAA